MVVVQVLSRDDVRGRGPPVVQVHRGGSCPVVCGAAPAFWVVRARRPVSTNGYVGNAGKCVSVRNGASEYGWSSLRRGRLRNGITPSRCKVASIVAPFIGPHRALEVRDVPAPHLQRSGDMMRGHLASHGRLCAAAVRVLARVP